MTGRCFRLITAAVLAAVVVWFTPMLSFAQGAAAPKAPSGAVPGSKAAASPVSTPHLADGHPDLNGVWIPAGQILVNTSKKKDEKGDIDVRLISPDGSATGFEVNNTIKRRSDPNRPVYKPELVQKTKDLDDNEATEDPVFFCKPAGVPRIGVPNQISQTPGQVVFLYQAGNTFRVIPTDGRPHSENVDQTFMGESVGHWDKDTLVVDAIGFNDISWLEIAGYFHSTNLHVIERLRRDGNLLHYQATVEDPNVLAKPWVRTPITLKISTSPEDALYEDPPCMETDTGHLVTKEHH
jgi:hypothetical protein